MRVRRRLGPVLLAAGALACSDGPNGSDGGAADGGRDAATFDLASPAPPELTPCPDGWMEAGGEPARCEPWSRDAPPECGAGEARFAGEPECGPVGAPCPTGEWPEDLPDANVLYVRAGETGGTGTRSSPFGTIDDATDRAAAGDVIALAKGSYEEAVRIGDGVTLRGACAAETVVRGPFADEDGVVVGLFGEGARLRDLQVTGPGIGISTGTGQSVTIEGVVVRDATEAGLLPLEGGRVTVRRLAIRGTRPSSAATSSGLAVGGGAEVSGEQVEIADTEGAGVLVRSADSRVALSRVRVASSSSPDGVSGQAVVVQAGATVALDEGVIEGARGAGVYAFGRDASATLARMVIRDIVPVGPEDVLGAGINVAGGARAELSRSLVAHNEYAGVVVSGSEGRLAIRDTIVSDAIATGEGEAAFGAGLLVLGHDGPADVVAERVVLERNQTSGIVVQDPDASAELADVVVRDSRADATGRTGRGLQAYDGALVQGERVRLAENREATVVAVGAETEIRLVDAEIIDTRERDCAETSCPDRPGGTGAISVNDARIALDRFVVSRHPLAGVHVLRAGMDLRSGLVSDNTIGANVVAEGFDTDRLFDEVVYRDNGVNLDSAELPVPDRVSAPDALLP